MVNGHKTPWIVAQCSLRRSLQLGSHGPRTVRPWGRARVSKEDKLAGRLRWNHRIPMMRASCFFGERQRVSCTLVIRNWSPMGQGATCKAGGAESDGETVEPLQLPPTLITAQKQFETRRGAVRPSIHNLEAPTQSQLVVLKYPLMTQPDRRICLATDNCGEWQPSQWKKILYEELLHTRSQIRRSHVPNSKPKKTQESRTLPYSVRGINWTLTLHRPWAAFVALGGMPVPRAARSRRLISGNWFEPFWRGG